jgi:hypothetical protein
MSEYHTQFHRLLHYFIDNLTPSFSLGYRDSLSFCLSLDTQFHSARNGTVHNLLIAHYLFVLGFGNLIAHNNSVMEYQTNSELGGHTIGSALSPLAIDCGYQVILAALHKQTGGRRGTPLPLSFPVSPLVDSARRPDHPGTCQSGQVLGDRQ